MEFLLFVITVYIISCVITASQFYCCGQVGNLVFLEVDIVLTALMCRILYGAYHLATSLYALYYDVTVLG
jgi:hypothetical protein